MLRVPRAFLDWLTVPRSLAIVGVALGLEAWLVHRAYVRGDTAAASGALQLAPVVAFVIAAPLIALFFHYLDWIDERTWAPWQGIYHAFDDHQIRVVEARGCLWFSSRDVHAALGIARRPGVLRAMRTAECRRDDALGDVLSTAGLARLFERSTDRSALRLLAWARNDVERIWLKKRAMSATEPSPAP